MFNGFIRHKFLYLGLEKDLTVWSRPGKHVQNSTKTLIPQFYLRGSVGISLPPLTREQRPLGSCSGDPTLVLSYNKETFR